MPTEAGQHKLLKQVLVYVTAVGCLVWVFHGTDFEQLKQNLGRMNWAYFGLAAAFNASVYLSNAWRWKELLLPVVRVTYGRTLQAIYVGLFLNEVLPLRPGELVRCGVLARRTPELRFTTALSSITIERLAEALILQFAFIIVVLFRPVPRSLMIACAVMTVAVGAAVTFLFVEVRRSRSHLISRPAGRMVEAWRRFVQGIHAMIEIRPVIAVAVLSVAALLLNILAAWALLQSCGISLPFFAAAAVLIIIRVGTAIPITPGSVGAYQFFAVLALRIFGVGGTAAATFTVVAFAAYTIPLLIGGAIAFAFAGSKYSELVSFRTRYSEPDNQTAG